MLIHLRNEGFDYKTPYVMRIKAAFEQMLVERIKSAGIRRSINNSAVA